MLEYLDKRGNFMYLHVGTKNIKSILFNQITNNSPSLKPKGGFWLSDLINDQYSEWVEYLSTHPALLIHTNLWFDGKIPCLKLSLKENSKIFVLDSDEKLNYLLHKYPYNNFFNYQLLSHDYDGIMINFNKLPNKEIWFNLRAIYSINTLILFNLNCIKEYYEGDIYPLGIYDDYCFEGYDFNFSPDKKNIVLLDEEDNYLINKIKEAIQNFYLKNSLDNKDYPKIEYFILQEFQKELEFLKSKEKVKESSLVRTLINNATTQF